jgi:anti-anti-sigma factor
MSDCAVAQDPFTPVDRHGVARICLQGELDLDNHAALLSRVLDVVHQRAVTSIVIDMSAVTFMDSSAIRVLDTGYAEAAAADKPLRLINLNRNVRRIFELLLLHDLIDDPAAGPPEGGGS